MKLFQQEQYTVLPGFYGQNCSYACSCQHGVCDPVSGTCHCDTGYVGLHCQQTCPEWTYGPQTSETGCSSVCACPEDQAGGCDPVTGQCVCKPGWHGKLFLRHFGCVRYCTNCKKRCPVFSLKSTSKKCIFLEMHGPFEKFRMWGRV